MIEDSDVVYVDFDDLFETGSTYSIVNSHQPYLQVQLQDHYSNIIIN
jgi:hypothetical protein